MDEPPDVQDRLKASQLQIDRGSVKFEEVFHYQKLSQDLSIDIPAGQTIAIVGHSGKSTIRAGFCFDFMTLTGFGQDAGFTQDSLHRFIGVVPQDTVLFNDTIYYNIAYGRAATRNEVIEAAKNAHPRFIMLLPDRYETRVGER